MFSLWFSLINSRWTKEAVHIQLTASIGCLNTLNFNDNVKSFEFNDLFSFFGESQTAALLDTQSKGWLRGTKKESIKKTI